MMPTTLPHYLRTMFVVRIIIIITTVVIIVTVIIISIYLTLIKPLENRPKLCSGRKEKEE